MTNEPTKLRKYSEADVALLAEKAKQFTTNGMIRWNQMMAESPEIQELAGRFGGLKHLQQLYGRRFRSPTAIKGSRSGWTPEELAILMRVAQEFKEGNSVGWASAKNVGRLDELLKRHTQTEISSRYSYATKANCQRKKQGRPLKQLITVTEHEATVECPSRYHINHCPNCGCPLKGAAAGLDVESSANT